MFYDCIETHRLSLIRRTLQALTEAYAAKHAGGSMDVDGACPCSMSNDTSPSQELSRRLDVAALDYISAVPFIGNDLFELIRRLEQPHERRGENEPLDSSGSGVQLPDGKMSLEPDVALECLLTSHRYRVLAEECVEKGRPDQAAFFFSEAISQGSSYLPGRCVAN